MTFFIIDWFTDPPKLFFGKMKKNKIKNLFFIPSYPKIYSTNGLEYRNISPPVPRPEVKMSVNQLIKNKGLHGK